MLSFEDKYWLAHSKDFDVFFLKNGQLGLTFYPGGRPLRFKINRVGSMIELVGQLENFAYTKASGYDQAYILEIIKNIPLP